MPAGADRDDPGGACGDQRIMQADGEREVAEMIGGELHFVAARRQRQLLDGHHPGVVDQDVQRPVPSADEGGDAAEVAQLQRADGDRGIPGVFADLRGDPLARGGIAHRECHRRTCGRQRPRGLDADARRCAGDDGALAAQVDAINDLGGRRCKAKWCRDGGVHAPTER